MNTQNVIINNILCIDFAFEFMKGYKIFKFFDDMMASNEGISQTTISSVMNTLQDKCVLSAITVSKDIIIIASINCRHEHKLRQPIQPTQAKATESMINENKYKIECLRTILSNSKPTVLCFAHQKTKL